MPADPDLLMSKHNDAHPTGIADLLGKRLVSVSETKQDRHLDVALVKRLTGGDTVKARFMRQNFFQFEPSHLLIMATNHLPVIDDDTEAVWRRIKVIPFAVQIPEDQRDEQLKDRLRAEADVVLSWIIAGWKDYRDGGLRAPDAVLIETDRYKDESDAVGRFINEECHVGGAQSSATTAALYRRWLEWSEREKVSQLSKVAFGRVLDRKGFPVDMGGHGWPRRGISLRNLLDS
jgi:putative DNA primase/helicase